MTESIQRTVLENGLRVLSERMEGVRSVSVGALVDVGPKDEHPVEHGYAHLVQHMVFRGTGERDAGSIAGMMEVGGGSKGAFTSRDYTVYHAAIPDDYLPFALQALGDRLCSSVLPEEAFDRQRSVIADEVASPDGPARQAHDVLKANLWPCYPLGYPIAGLPCIIQRATRERLLDFMHRHYVADRLIMVAAGNIDHEGFAAQVRDSFRQMKRGEEIPLPLLPPITNLGCVSVVRRDLPRVHFAAAWPAPNYTSPNRYAWHAFTALFGGGPTSRLHRRLHDEQGLAYHIAARYQAYGSTGALVVEGAALPRTLVSVLAGILLELGSISEGVIDEEGARWAIQSLISRHLGSCDTAYERMNRLALQELYFRRSLSSDEVIAGLRSQSPATVQQVARGILDTGLPTIALVGPVDESLERAVGNMLADFGAPSEILSAPERENELMAASSDAGPT